MKKFFGAIFIFVLLSGIAHAQASGNQIAGGTYFNVYSDGAADAYAVLSKIDLNYLVYSGSAANGADNVSDMLAKTLDGLYLEVSDILDIHIYSFQGRIEILTDQNAVNSAFKNLFAQDFNERSFYIPEKNAIYLSFADLTLGLLGHEIAHAIISRYFVVPPPAKVQEVLSGYVEYKLRKSTE